MNEANEFSLAIGALINIKKQRGKILINHAALIIIAINFIAGGLLSSRARFLFRLTT